MFKLNFGITSKEGISIKTPASPYILFYSVKNSGFSVNPCLIVTSSVFDFSLRHGASIS